VLACLLPACLPAVLVSRSRPRLLCPVAFPAAPAEAGRMRLAREEFAALVAAGHRGNEFAYAGLANCYRHMVRRLVGMPVSVWVWVWREVQCSGGPGLGAVVRG
jgi:hypothetical protein